jgi:SAM-dependent methyltransferase
VDRLPTVGELARLYSDEFFQGSSAYRDYVAEQAALQANSRRRIEVIRRFSDGGDLFEAGCAHGFFLKEAGDYWRARGIDISREAIVYAREELGVSAEQGDFESNPPPPGSFDVIAMWDTIEHLYDPVLSIYKSAEALRPGGVIALTTGDADTLVPRLRRKSWRLVHPTHLYYFTQRSLTQLLERYGLEVVHLSYEATYRSLREMAKVLVWGTSVSGWRRWLYRRIEKLPFLGMQIPLNLHDIMFVIAGKHKEVDEGV